MKKWNLLSIAFIESARDWPSTTSKELGLGEHKLSEGPEVTSDVPPTPVLTSFPFLMPPIEPPTSQSVPAPIEAGPTEAPPTSLSSQASMDALQARVGALQGTVDDMNCKLGALLMDGMSSGKKKMAWLM